MNKITKDLIDKDWSDLNTVLHWIDDISVSDLAHISEKLVRNQFFDEDLPMDIKIFLEIQPVLQFKVKMQLIKCQKSVSERFDQLWDSPNKLYKSLCDQVRTVIIEYCCVDNEDDEMTPYQAYLWAEKERLCR